MFPGASAILHAQTDLGTITLINSFETPQDLQNITTRSASFKQVTTDATDGQYALEVDYQVTDPFPTVWFHYQPTLDWSAKGGVAFDVCNPGTQSVTVNMNITDESAISGDSAHNENQNSIIAPLSCASVLNLFQVATPPLSMGMQHPPPVPGFQLMSNGSGTADFSHVYHFEFWLNQPTAPVTLIFDNIRSFTAPASSLVSYTGMVDSYGQFTRETWPGKISSDADLTAQAQAEAALPPPDLSGLDQYGGSLSLPAQTATGFFHTTRDPAGKWWLVTPAGHLYLSIGMDKVVAANANRTDVQGRLQMFTSLPAQGDALSPFYVAAGNWPPPAGLNIQFNLGMAFDFYPANLFRKYGSSYNSAWMKSTVDRLGRWGFNDITSFSDPAIFPAKGSSGQQMPHTVTLYYSSCTGCGPFATVPSSQDYWGPMVDPFDPAWTIVVDTNFKQQAAAFVNDPYVVGYFVDNELSWAGGVNDPRDDYHFSLVYGTLKTGATQPAKVAFEQMLMAEYADVTKLNQIWGTNYATWNDFLSASYSPPVPLPNAAMRSDFSAFLLSFAEQYFRIIGGTIKKYDPHHLYLGVKFAALTMEEWQACAELCDVISFDDYNFRLDPNTWSFIHQFATPALLAEFGFCARDRGGFTGGIPAVPSQAAKSIDYGQKLEDAMTNPDLIGANFYKYIDDPVSGEMSDGENNANGWVALSDTPYAEFTTFAASMNKMSYTWRNSVPPVSGSPTVTSLSPPSLAPGSGDTLLTVAGTGFSSSSVVQWNGSPRQTLVVSATQLVALIGVADLTAPGAAQVTVVSSGSGGVSNTAITNIGNPPVITGVSNAAGGQAGVPSGAFFSIYGSNFTSLAYDDWSGSIHNGALPTSLDGVSVTVGGKPAFIAAITPGQVNAQAPDIAAGAAQIVVTTPIGSAAFAAAVQPLSPAFFLWPGSQPVATHTDYTWAVNGGTFPGTTTVPAKPGEIIILWGTGFGPTNPTVPAGQEPTALAPPTQAPVSVTLGGISVSVLGAVLSAYAATYQIAIQVPASMANGNYPLVASVDGVQSPSNVLLAVQH